MNARLLIIVLSASLTCFAQQPNPNIGKSGASDKTSPQQQPTTDGKGVVVGTCPNCSLIEKCVDCFAVADKVKPQPPQPEAYDPRQDLLYRAYLAFTVFGVIGALVGIAIIFRQTNAAQDAAIAARDNAQAVINAERAWVIVWVKWPKDFASYNEAVNFGVRTYSLFLNVACANHGQSLAWITESRIGMIVTEKVPDTLDMSNTVLADEDTFKPLVVNKELFSPDVQVESQVMPEPGKMILVYGKVTYRDIFFRERYTTFGFRLMEDRQRFERLTLPAYNKHT